MIYRISDNKSISNKFPIQVKQMTTRQTKEYHLKRLYELSLKTAKQKEKSQ